MLRHPGSEGKITDQIIVVLIFYCVGLKVETCRLKRNQRKYVVVLGITLQQ